MEIGTNVVHVYVRRARADVNRDKLGTFTHGYRNANLLGKR